jgi:hypothetical protein
MTDNVVISSGGMGHECGFHAKQMLSNTDKMYRSWRIDPWNAIDPGGQTVLCWRHRPPGR